MNNIGAKIGSNSLFEPGSRARVTDMDQIKAVVSLRFALVKASFKSYLWQAVFSLGMLWYLFSMTKGESENLTSTVAFMPLSFSGLTAGFTVSMVMEKSQKIKQV